MKTKNLHPRSNPYYWKNFIASSISTSKTINHLKEVHAHLLKTRTHPMRDHLLVHLLSKLRQISGNNLNFYLKYACNLFDEIPHCNDQFIWTSLIRRHVVHGSLKKSIVLYVEMHSMGIRPSGFTFSSVLSACARIPRIVVGKQVHARVIQSGFCVNAVVQTVLLDMYGKCRLVLDARSIFDEMSSGERDVDAWTAMISAYAKIGSMDDARELFDCMGQQRNVVTWSNMVAGYSSIGSMDAAKSLFDEMPERNSIAWVAMIAGYGKCGAVVEAKRVFDEIRVPDETCWAAIIACYAQNGYSIEAIELFEKMRRGNVKITEVAMVAAISACTQSGDADKVNALTKDMEKMGFDQTLYISNALLHMHAKCGNVDQAWKELDRMTERDVVSYNTLISAMADHGRPLEALKFFARMETEGIKPNQITFIGVLNACSHAGLIDEGLKNFQVMTHAYGIKPLPEHYVCIVDLLSRAGQLDKAYNLIVNNASAVSAASVWDAFFGACCVHGNVELAESAASRVFEPWNTGNYVLLANLYASVGRWHDAERLRKTMREYEMMKSPGCSWISNNR